MLLGSRTSKEVRWRARASASSVVRFRFGPKGTWTWFAPLCKHKPVWHLTKTNCFSCQQLQTIKNKQVTDYFGTAYDQTKRRPNNSSGTAKPTAADAPPIQYPPDRKSKLMVLHVSQHDLYLQFTIRELTYVVSLFHLLSLLFDPLMLQCLYNMFMYVFYVTFCSRKASRSVSH